ncbi:MAG: hypothetical protein A4E65_00826 [Syntrophorhabdus sp. PtaU1.Bin153]|jgi:hypothetical protein|nr:MAG: hypothetical protein A4E65_00826 [Syntrophorhabdus sp. PtaU1.Bin153]
MLRLIRLAPVLCGCGRGGASFIESFYDMINVILLHNYLYLIAGTTSR